MVRGFCPEPAVCYVRNLRRRQVATIQTKKPRAAAGLVGLRYCLSGPTHRCSVMDERLRFVAKLLDGETMTDACREFGISRKTGYKIFSRYKESGFEALTDVDEGIWIVSFMQYDLGYIDLEQKTLQPLDNPFGARLSPMS